ncbi:hypothetical protein J1761_gp04 [Gordonia phage Kroos]|uniref:Uncharacterized protein n=2 Tax=Schenleyvirinae TaxID=3424859 RepID=A0A3G3M949_9CAUD|nr:hypothetical protein J1761_gp04 [Gordonia phage Kroos]YP_010002661.1 hypothetical protein J1774_gp03 [Gordonia Phage Zitch]AYR02983.1 hypothetical protein SEA_KROOS_4 [Gordonia phage Kroos]QKY78450.1 hypothetical protein SEA_ZITCH_3 [Gordonia Phage Zitch]
MFPTCTICGETDVEDAGDHADSRGHWPVTAVTAAAGRIVGRVGHEHIVANGVGTVLGAKMIAAELRRNPGMSESDLCAAVIARAEKLAAR